VKVAFIGLGKMGAPMARNLIEAGHTLTLYNRTRARAESFAAQDAKVADTPATAVADAEAIITMLSGDRAVEETVIAPGQALEAAAPGTVHVSMSTISVALSRRLGTAHGQARQHFVAAPVFGRPDLAEAGKLFVMAAGPHAQIDRCRPLFAAMGQKTFVLGAEPPAANLAKLAGNFMISAVIESLAESMALVRKSGVDASTFLEALTGSLFTAPIYQGYGRMIAADTYEPAGFGLPLGFKDNRLLLAAAEEAGVPMPLASLVRDRLLGALAQGLGEADWAAFARLSLRDAGVVPSD
jgi:3-hydroxyisobutyrate dehydrogenase-like beta-hydroxyacid dehydrogenase